MTIILAVASVWLALGAIGTGAIILSWYLEFEDFDWNRNLAATTVLFGPGALVVAGIYLYGVWKDDE